MLPTAIVEEECTACFVRGLQTRRAEPGNNTLPRMPLSPVLEVQDHPFRLNTDEDFAMVAAKMRP
ncbi:MAG: hypothetical protein ACXAC5_02030 [Promethearchaeota archaeon]